MKTADQSSRNVRLGMAILVRDEEDIIADNIRFHMTQGVETFIVTDNGSVDGTREILESLRGEIDIEIIDEASHTIDQDLWMTRMACRLREQGRADWVILGDADEFWVSRSGDLRSEITPRRGVHECATHNMLPRQSDVLRQDYRFFCNVMKVARPLGHIPPQPFSRPFGVQIDRSFNQQCTHVVYEAFIFLLVLLDIRPSRKHRLQSCLTIFHHCFCSRNRRNPFMLLAGSFSFGV